MEPTRETQITESPNPALAPKGRVRCQARNRSGSQCRLHVQPPSGRLCSRHAARADKITTVLDDSTDLFDEIFEDNELVLNTTENINAVLSNIVFLAARGRISPRRAAVISYALSLILRSVVVMDRNAANEPPQITWDAPRPKPDNPQPSASY